MVPPAPTMEESERLAGMFRDVIAYFQEHGVRVVNMSWVIDFGDIEQSLERNGVGKDPGERAKIARELFAVQRDGLEAAMRGAPEILFVGGAGNSDDDVSFEQIIPPAFDLPNHIAAGAVDESGRATSFTSFGNRVDVYANGYEIESYVPGGERMKFSGTSMSSPQVTNLAAKLLAIDPSLTPERVIALILEGADRPHDDELLAVVNPARTVELLRQRAD
jgi:subtilisin family serine protease